MGLGLKFGSTFGARDLHKGVKFIFCCVQRVRLMVQVAKAGR